MAKHHRELIEFLQNNHFKADCSQCGTPFKLKDTMLFPIDEFTPKAMEKMNEIKEALKDRKLSLQQLTAKKKQRIATTTKSVNMGFILERLAPVLEQFRFNKNDCRSLFDPIDYVIFDGLHKNGKVQKIFFIDISGTGVIRLRQTDQVALPESLRLASDPKDSGEVVQLLENSTLWSMLLLLRFQLANGSVKSVIICPDSLDEGSFRALSTACRWIAGQNSVARMSSR